MFAATLAAVLMLSLCSSVAFAGWSAPQSFGVSRYATTAVAVDARGDAAVAWATRGSPSIGPRFRTSVHVTVRSANGRLSTRTVWSSNDAEPLGVSVVLTASEVTVAWGSFNRAGTGTVRAAYGPLIGRWCQPRAIGRISVPAFYPPVPWVPHLAVASDGEVLLAWSHWNGKYGHEQERRGAAVAWRAPGRRFGAPQVLPDAPGGAVPQFDARGTAYLYGYCSGLVPIAPAHTHRFGRTVVLMPRQALAFDLSLTGSGRGLATWIAGECSFDAAAGNTPGPVFASVLSAGAFGKPLELTPADTAAFYSNAVATPGGGTVNWATYGPHGSETFSLQIGTDGLSGATQQITGGLIALTADGGGDQVFGPVPVPSTPIALVASPVFVRPAGGGADQPGPGRPGQVAVAAPVGRAVVWAWNASPTGAGSTMVLSVWRP
ncbi:MAG TPA: hypothetical protein VKG82_04455 [Solirubrobacteraceae bacterium]|nr:hypothetical protein [Solirubrobacteraceae bacterium]